jgi:hypothetical protein
MNCIKDIPNCVFPFIQEYLTRKEYGKLMNSSKKIFWEIRFETVYLELSRNSSKQYVGDQGFREHLQSKLRHCGQQVSLELLSQNPDGLLHIFPVDECRVICTGKMSFKSFRVHRLYIQGENDNPQYVWNNLQGEFLLKSLFGIPSSVSFLSLTSFSNLTDISNLSHLSEAAFSHCMSLAIVSPLKKLRKLSLISCLRIVDITDLSEIPFLLLKDCSNIETCYELQNSMIIVDNCVKFRHFNYLKHSKKISINSNCPMPSFLLSSFHSCSEISIQGVHFCHDVRTTLGPLAVSLPPFLKKVRFRGCDSLRNCDFLSTLFEVRLEYCNGITSVECLGEVKLLTINSCRKIKSLKELGKNNRSVTIGNSTITDFSPLQSVFEVNYFIVPVSCLERI